ncbi:MAG: hypothetical protein HS111_38360 [Kofleriaceae bacterium]|nr:hypothetical protein [Kofleriaceae bacterium]MCL4224960.1 hypothetical protein [Myxococcales bacterium]
MPPVTCADARAAIEHRRFDGWRGLPPDCTPDALFGVALDDTWGQLPLGAAHLPTRSRLLELPGYYRPLARVRDGRVVLFEGGNPALAGDLADLLASLGAADEVADYVFRDVAMPRGEHVHAGRGITLYVNPETMRVLHVALYHPTTVDAFRRELQPELGEKRR